MAMSQLQQTMATLRITLAEIQHKEEQLDAAISQFRTQLRRLPRQAIYGRTPLDFALSAMGEIEERLADAEATRRRLLEIKRTAREELAALESVKQVDEARRSLADLRRQARAGAATRGDDGGNAPAGVLYRPAQQAGGTNHHRPLPGTAGRLKDGAIPATVVPDFAGTRYSGGWIPAFAGMTVGRRNDGLGAGTTYTPKLSMSQPARRQPSC